MKKMKTLLVALAMMLTGVAAQAAVKPIILDSPDDYQVLALSPNGEWATGVFVDYGQAQHGFLWNLLSGEIKLLSTNTESYGSSVSNDGVVAGHFTYTPAGGPSYEMPGYYKDDSWHPVEMPLGMTVGNLGSAGQGGGITPDGSRMSGALYINGVYTPFTWNIAEGGKIVHQLDITNPEGTSMSGNAYCISPDGKMAGGWAYRYNRTCTIWDTETGAKQHVGLIDHNHQTPWASVDRFSPDGKKVIFGGGWDYDVPETSANQWGFRVYDIETGEITRLSTIGETPLNIFGISNSYTCVGQLGDYDQGQAVIYVDNQPKYMTQYLTEKGVDLRNLSIFEDPENAGVLTMFRGQDISADDNVLAILYYHRDWEGYAAMRTMIVMFNQDAEHAAPTDVTVKQLSGINVVSVEWKKPVRAAQGINGFAVYRDGKKLGEADKDATVFYDKEATIGNHEYIVATLYTDGNETAIQNSMKITVKAKEIQAPEGLYGRQKGNNSLYAEWDAPQTNFINKSWYTPATANLTGFGVGGAVGYDIETGIGFKKEEMENYAGTKITAVKFYPMSKQENLKLNIYKYDANDKPVCIHTQDVTQELTYRKQNTVKLTTPVDLPTDGDIVVAFSQHLATGSVDVIGMDNAHYTAGYSDLIRFVDEPDFYSYYQMTAKGGYPDYMSLMIDMVLQPEGADEKSDIVDSYKVYLDGELLTEADERNCVITNAVSTTSAKDYELGVSAVYMDGTESPVATQLVNMRAVYPAIATPKVEAVSASKALVSWDAPVDDDAFTVTYSGTAAGTNASYGVNGPAENNYGFIASANYPAYKFKGYDGYTIDAFRFYPTADATFTFMLLKDEEQIAEVEVDDYQLNKWNVVKLSEPIHIDATSAYRLVLDIYDATPDLSPLAIDNRTPYSGFSDLFFAGELSEETTWLSVSGELGLRGNWMMGMDLVAPDAHEVETKGYDVYLSEPGSKATTQPTKRNDERVLTNSFEYDFGKDVNGEGKVRVAVYYEGRTTAVNTAAIGYTFDFVDAINNVVINGSDVEGYSIYATNGKRLAEGMGNTFSSAALAPGIYVVKIKTTTGKEVVRKLEIK